MINLPTANHATADWGPLQLCGAREDGWGLRGGLAGGLATWAVRHIGQWE